MKQQYIIIQAGGRGSRMSQLTENKPKSLISVNNLPIIFHLFHRFPAGKFFIIGDYKIDVLKKYLQTFAADVDYLVIDARPDTGTCAGIRQALSLIPDHRDFWLFWSDLVVSDAFQIPEQSGALIGVSDSFRCRWSFDGSLAPVASSKCGVAGVFRFPDKSLLQGIPLSGEFVKWLQTKQIAFTPFTLTGVREIGTYQAFLEQPVSVCRPFNRLEIHGETLTKIPLNEQGKALAQNEAAWYRFISQKQYSRIPAITCYAPLTMALIQGKNAYAFRESDFSVKKTVLFNIVNELHAIHRLESVPANAQDCLKTYIDKTFERIQTVQALIPFAGQESVVINGKTCHNAFVVKDQITKLIYRHLPSTFTVIHGDSTFSNILIEQDLRPVFIDPRGYFGSGIIFGDPAYDFAKLYYSCVGNYDTFNRKQFTLKIDKNSVNLSLVSNGFEALEKSFFEWIGNISPQYIKLLHALIWLGLTTYAWDDYDSVCGAYYRGISLLEEVLNGNEALF